MTMKDILWSIGQIVVCLFQQQVLKYSEDDWRRREEAIRLEEREKVLTVKIQGYSSKWLFWLSVWGAPEILYALSCSWLPF